jgi:hypothetical protein
MSYRVLILDRDGHHRIADVDVPIDAGDAVTDTQVVTRGQVAALIKQILGGYIPDNLGIIKTIDQDFGLGLSDSVTTHKGIQQQTTIDSLLGATDAVIILKGSLLDTPDAGDRLGLKTILKVLVSLHTEGLITSLGLSDSAVMFREGSNVKLRVGISDYVACKFDGYAIGNWTDRPTPESTFQLTHISDIADVSALSNGDEEQYKSLTENRLMSHKSVRDLGIKGVVTVQVEDTDGNIISSVTAENNLTTAAMYQLLDQGFSNMTNIANILQSNLSSTLGQNSVVQPSGLSGIYCLSKEIEVSTNMTWRPYLDETQAARSTDVCFYNEGGTSAETTMTLLPQPTRSCFDIRTDSASYTFEYTKTSGEGTIASVCIGLAAGQGYPYGIQYSEPIPQTFHNGTQTANYCLEHTSDRTILYKTISQLSSYTSSFDMMTKEVATAASVSFDSVPNFSGGLVWTSGFVKSCYKSVVASDLYNQFAAKLYYSTTAHSSATVSDVSFEFPLDATIGSLDTGRGAMPILVMRPDTNELEIFASMEYDGEGCRLVKAVIPLNAPTTAPTFVEMGQIPYIIGSQVAGTTTPYYYLTGYYDVQTQQYYLPITGKVDDQGAMTRIGSNSLQLGVIFRAPESSGDVFTSESYVDDFLYSLALGASTSPGCQFFPCRTDRGIEFIAPSTQSSPLRYAINDTVWSGVNLPTPVVKGLQDIVRVMYTYQLANTSAQQLQ